MALACVLEHIIQGETVRREVLCRRQGSESPTQLMQCVLGLFLSVDLHKVILADRPILLKNWNLSPLQYVDGVRNFTPLWKNRTFLVATN